MTIQTDAKTQYAPTSAESIRAENAEAAEAAGILPEAQPGASDNIAPQEAPAKRVSTDEIIERNLRQQADDREALMADIGRRRREAEMENHPELEDDYNELDNSDDNLDNQEQGQEATVAQDAQQATEQASQVPNNQPRFFTDAAGNRLVELMVNGKPTVVPESRVIAAAQKLEAGDERLRQAAQERQQLEADKVRFQQELAARQIQQPSVNPDAEADLRAQLRSGFERLVNDGDDSAMDALVDSIMKGRAPAIPAVDPLQVANQAIIIQNQKAWDVALGVADQKFYADPDYADISGNEVLNERAKEHAFRLVQEYDARNRNVDPLSIMQEAAEITRNEARRYAESLGYAAPQSRTQQGASRAETVSARKEQVGNTVTGGGNRAPAPAKKPDGGVNPSSRDARVAAFAELVSARTTPQIRR